jgi:histone H3/H4
MSKQIQKLDKVKDAKKRRKVMSKKKKSTIEKGMEQTSEKRKKYKVSQYRRAISQIKKMQKDTKTILPKAPIRRAVKSLIGKDTRITKDAFNVIHQHIENFFVDRLRKANQITLCKNKLTVTPDDIAVVSSIME